ncbi:phosphotransferase family protein [Nonomuraea sp. NPDC050310]|uniref:phosphotransferase family protein n=1 Tax=unclassified Nonomuraea TaxID=2593643 RepID=UPI0033FBB725
MSAVAESVVEAVAGEVFGGSATVERAVQLSGGASRETWALDVAEPSGTRHELVLRLDTPALTLGPGADLFAEATLLRTAAATGVPVPRVHATGATPQGGRPYILMERVEGETIPRRILREEAYAPARKVLAAQCGQVLAAIHRMPPESAPAMEQDDPLRQWRDVLDLTGQPHPAFELAFRRLAETRPPRGRTTLVHGDFRNGNLIVGPEGLRAVLDWELAHPGDPLEDLGWLCVKAWRFGAGPPVGGFGGYDELVAAYERAGGGPVDRAALAWWERFGTLKWGIICVMQAMRHLSGASPSVELAAIGRRVCETEWDLLS